MERATKGKGRAFGVKSEKCVMSSEKTKTRRMLKTGQRIHAPALAPEIEALFSTTLPTLCHQPTMVAPGHPYVCRARPDGGRSVRLSLSSRRRPTLSPPLRCVYIVPPTRCFSSLSLVLWTANSP